MPYVRPEPTRAFTGLARDYARGRPDYPDAVFDAVARRLRLRRGDRVMDLGAGTGISTRPLVARGYRVVAVEPNRSMLAVAKAAHPSWRFVRARAERLPFRPVFKAVFCAQTFHWFDLRAVSAEIERLSRGLAAFWNSRDVRDPFFRDFRRLIRRYNPSHRADYRVPPRWLGARCAAVEHRVRFTPDRFVTLALSVSYVRHAVKGAARRAFLRDLRAMIRRHFGGGPMDLPYVTSLWIVTGRRFRGSPPGRAPRSARWSPARRRTRRRA